jgi:hypothetical protein
MNMEEWQRRMKAEKEAERKKKMESTEILKGYRGGVADEDKKLLAIRQEVRQKQMDAEQMLHEYRGKESPIGRKRPERHERFHIPPSVERGVDPLAQIAPGSVSAKAANLMASLSPSVSPSKGSVAKATTREIMDTGPATPLPRAIDTDIESALADTTSDLEEKKYEMEDKYAFDQKPVEFAFLGEEPSPQEVCLAPAPSKPEIRYDLPFSFGIVTGATPDIASYMAAVEELVHSVISRVDPSENVCLKPECAPYVINQQWDSKYRRVVA